jgi:hypothetical protein
MIAKRSVSGEVTIFTQSLQQRQGRRGVGRN